MRRRVRLVHSELAVVAMGISTALWLRQPSLLWAGAAVLAGLTALVGALVMRRLSQLVTAAAAMLAAVALLASSIRVRTVESDWSALREQLVADAGVRLGRDLSAAVSLADALANQGVGVLAEPRSTAFRTLGRVVGGARLEHGVVTFDRSLSPWAWAGKLRAAPEPRPLGEATLAVRITPFYVVLEASRQTAAGWAVGQVLLQADSAVSDRDASLAERFRGRTGVAMDILSHGVAVEGAAVFDYCRPACAVTVEGELPDTLMSVQLTPPSQGALKLQLERVGGTWGAVFALTAFLLLLVVGSGRARWVGIGGAVGVLVLTPAGELVGFPRLFSPANFYLDFFGPFGASSGALLLTAVLTAIVLALAPRRPPGRHGWIGWAGIAFAAAIPYALWTFTGGITPQSTGTSTFLWLSWQVPLAMSGVALGLVALLARPPGNLGRWRAPLGIAATVAAAALGFAVWDPTIGWPWWYALVWAVPLVLGSQAASPMRGLLEITVVAGFAATMLTWNADVRGRMLLAQRDTDRLIEGDPVAIGQLYRFGDDLRAAPPPQTEAELYARWRRSPLSRDDYPAALATWSPEGRVIASVELASLDLAGGPIRLVVEVAREAGRVVLIPQDVDYGVRYLLAAPFPDGSVVTVVVGPRSRLIAHVLEARFLRGERRLDTPYEMTLGDVVSGASAVPNQMEWSRDRGAVRGNRVLGVSGGPRRLHVAVPLRSPAQLVIRGVLVVLLNVVAVGLIAVVAAGARRGFGIPVTLKGFARLGSYRTRLAIALAAFFVLPTLGFALWSVRRIQANADSNRDLLIQHALGDASEAAQQLDAGDSSIVRRELEVLSTQVGADLFLYDRGILTATSTPVLAQLGLVDPYLAPRVFLSLFGGDVLELSADALIGGQRTRVGYRALGHGSEHSPILVSPRLVDVSDIESEQEDLILGVFLAALVGLAAAGGLAAVASRSLARPVQALRTAAQAVGRGDPLPAFFDDMPDEFVPVVDAFERMVADIERSQTALEAARSRMAAVLANVATGVVALNRDMRVTIANPRAAELLGQRLPAGEKISDLGSSAWAPVWQWTERMLAAGDELASEEFNVGTRRIRAQVAALRTQDGGGVLAVDDITELARAVRVLAWGELAQQIAHEIKNPLTPIRLGIQHLRRARRDGRADFDYTLERTGQQILAEIERLDAIARAFARFGAPPAEAEALGVTDLGTLARETADLYRSEEGPTVLVEGNEEVLGIARRDEVKEVLINLIENARDAGASQVVLRVGGANGQARVVVQDNGHGITAEHLVRVFEPQFSTTSSGTGLGLAICKRLVEGWGGTIAVDSQVGEGTRVVIEVTGGPRAEVR